MTMNTTSASLLEQLRQPTNRASWERFVLLYTPLLYYWARKLGLREADSAEMVQETFVVLFQKLPTFEYERQKGFRNWLRTILLNKWRNQVRKEMGERRAHETIDLDALADTPEDDGLTETEYHQHLISHAMDYMRREFPPMTWKVCWEVVVLDRPATVVAAELGIVVGTVYAAKSRVLKRLREYLAGLLD